MDIDTAREFFSHICGQNRDFVADGVLLPLAQRCLGLYVGALLTALWLFGSGIWRRGLPSGSILWLNVALLLAAMLGGVHVIDPGPLWRFACGLWTGHVCLLWLSGAAVQFLRLSRTDALHVLPWSTVDTAQGWAFPAALVGLAALSPTLLALGWRFWTAAASLGVFVLATAIIAALLAIGFWILQSWRFRHLHLNQA